MNEYEKVNFTDSMMEFSKSEQNNDKTEEQVYKSLLSHFSIQTHKTGEFYIQNFVKLVSFVHTLYKLFNLLED